MTDKKYSALVWINTVTADSTLSSSARHVAVRLAMHANSKGGNAHPGRKRLAETIGMSVRTVERALVEVCENGYARRVFHGSTASKRNLADVYQLLLPVRDQSTSQHDQSTYEPDQSTPVTTQLSLSNSPVLNCSESGDSGPTLTRRTRAPNPNDLDESGEGLIEWLEEQHGGLDVMETNTALGMWGDDRHPLMISNTIEKMRSWG